MVRRTLLLMAGLAIAGPAASQEYVVDLEAPREVKFISQTTLEGFEGVTDRIDGYVYLGEGTTSADLAPGARLTGSSLYLEVDLASIDTGIGLRNRHMREEYLETDDFPFATFEGVIAAVGEHPDGGLRITSPGTFSAHGIGQTRTIDCQVQASGDGYRVGCAFMVSLSDHQIEVPRVMFLKLAEEVRVEIDFSLKPASGEQS